MDAVTAAWQVLDDVDDPCSVASGCPLSLVEMQLVKSVEHADGRLRVTLQLTEPSCMLSFHIAEEVEGRLRERLGVDAAVEVRLTHDPGNAWHEGMIQPEARERLTAFRRRRALILAASPPDPTHVEEQR